MNLYQWRMLFLRILYGMIGAIVFYYFIRSGLLGGTAFPVLTRAPPTDGVTGSIPAPSQDIAKLIVWSFLAGFSERLVSDALNRQKQ